MYGLFLIAVLTVATLALGHRLGHLRDLGLVIGASVVGGLVVLIGHPGLAWVGEPPADEGTCGSDADPFPAIRVERIDVARAQSLLGDETVTFVDARSGSDYVAAHIPGAVSLPADDAAGILEIQSVPILPDGQVITYCNGGACEQSEYLGLLLRDRDVCKQVMVLEGGWAAWVDAKGPTASGEGLLDGVVSIEPVASEPSEPCEPTQEVRG